MVELQQRNTNTVGNLERDHLAAVAQIQEESREKGKQMEEKCIARVQNIEDEKSE